MSPDPRRDEGLPRWGSCRPPWAWVRVIRATPALTEAYKLIWEEHALLCHPRTGATIGAGALGRRLALDRRTVERARGDFLRWGMIQRVDRGPGLTASWFLKLPVACRPQHRRVTDDEVQSLGDALALHIQTGSTAIPRSNYRPDKTGVPPARETGDKSSERQAASSIRAGGPPVVAPGVRARNTCAGGESGEGGNIGDKGAIRGSVIEPEGDVRETAHDDPIAGLEDDDQEPF